MSAVEALKAARAAGVRVGIDGDALTLEASEAPSPGVLGLLSRHKAGIVALLRPANDGWSTEDWLAFYDERAGIAEFDGRPSRDQAEARAVACCVAEWLNRNPARSPPGRCDKLADNLIDLIVCEAIPKVLWVVLISWSCEASPIFSVESALSRFV
jgi:hypothetical protein